MAIGKIVSLPTSINFKGGRFKLDLVKGDFYSTRNSTVRGTIVNGQFGVYAGGMRPNLTPEKINLNDVVKQYGSLPKYLVAKGIIKEGENPKILAMFFAGGPAPSADAVFYAVTMEAHRNGMIVLGFEDGCEGVLKGDCVVMTPHNVWGINRQGDIFIGTARKNPNPEESKKIKADLKQWGISAVIGIGGDDTNTTLTKLSELGIPVVGVPKTIDNDLPGTDITFGHQTVIEASVREMSSLISDARSRDAWYMTKVMGRTSGSWAMRVAMAAGATRSIIGEEYSREGILQLHKASERYSALNSVLEDICEVIRVNGKKMPSVEALVKKVKNNKHASLTINIEALAKQIANLIERRAINGYHYGLVAIAEGIAEKLQIEVIERSEDGKPKLCKLVGLDIKIGYDEHQNPRLTDVPLADILSKMIIAITKNIPIIKEIKAIQASPDLGYQYRCEEVPAAFDIILAEALGVEVITMIKEGLFGNLVRIDDDQISFVPFSSLPRDPETKHIIPRLVHLGKYPYVQAKTLERAK